MFHSHLNATKYNSAINYEHVQGISNVSPDKIWSYLSTKSYLHFGHFAGNFYSLLFFLLLLVSYFFYKDRRIISEDTLSRVELDHYSLVIILPVFSKPK